MRVQHAKVLRGGLGGQFHRRLRLRVHVVDVGFTRAVAGDEHVFEGLISAVGVNDLIALNHPHIAGLHLLQRNAPLLILLSTRNRHGESRRVVGTIARFHTHHKILHLVLCSSFLPQRTFRNVSGNEQLLPLSVAETNEPILRISSSE